MNEKFIKKMGEEKVRKDSVLMGDFAQVYCDAKHKERPRTSLNSEGASLGVYGGSVPVVCDECAELLAYCEKRRAYCNQDPKPFCAHCEVHCYSPQKRKQVTEVMKYAGPRSFGGKHTGEAIKHVLEGRKFKKAQKKDES